MQMLFVITRKNEGKMLKMWSNIDQSVWLNVFVHPIKVQRTCLSNASKFDFFIVTTKCNFTKCQINVHPAHSIQKQPILNTYSKRDYRK